MWYIYIYIYIVQKKVIESSTKSSSSDRNLLGCWAWVFRNSWALDASKAMWKSAGAMPGDASTAEPNGRNSCWRDLETVRNSGPENAERSHLAQDPRRFGKLGRCLVDVYGNYQVYCWKLEVTAGSESLKLDMGRLESFSSCYSSHLFSDLQTQSNMAKWNHKRWEEYLW